MKSKKTKSAAPNSALTVPSSALPAPGSQPPFTEETALAFFARQLDGLNWKYHRLSEQPALFSGFNGKDVLWDFNMIARAKPDGLFHLSVNSFIPNKAKVALRKECAAVAELLTRINWELTVGCFEMNYADGEIRFRTGIILPGTDITDAIVENLLRSNLSIVDERFPQITAVIYSGASPEDALKPKEPEDKTQPRFDFN